MPITVPPNQAMAMQSALAALEEEKRKKMMGDFRSTHGGWYPNPAGFTPGVSARAMPKESAYNMLGAQRAPAVPMGRPVNAPQFAYTPPPGYEALVETPAAAPNPAPLEEAPVNVPPATAPMKRPISQASTKSGSGDENKKANARFREFMTTFGRR